VTALLIIDDFALFFMGLIIAAGFAVVILSSSYLAARPGKQDEYYLLLLLATIGSLVLVASSHFVSFFLGLEILSVALYALIAYPRLNLTVEAGVKYLILASASAGFLLFGMALIYAETGSMEFSAMSSLRNQASALGDVILLAGFGMLIVGAGFKLALVPFHMWTPDVYQGAPAPVTAFVATVSKGAMFAVLLRFFLQVDVTAFTGVFYLFAIIAIASMLAGNLLALRQSNVKRLLAYSSIAHLGYVLVAFLVNGALGTAAVVFYLTAYVVTTLGAFGVVSVLSGPDGDAESLDDYRGLMWRRPGVAAVFTAMLLSLTGIPLTAGFFGKFYILAAGVNSGLWVLVIALVLGSAIGVYYYLRIIVAMFMPAEGQETAPTRSIAGTAGAVLTGLSLMLLWLGVYPAPLIDLIQTIAGRM
jgi:NADH-quinone oxidoreductase subunit N